MVCCFFGHKDTPQAVEASLLDVLTDLIENHQVHLFYVGNHGAFDAIVRRVLKKLKEHYPFMDYAVVLAYLPVERKMEDYSDTVFPEGLEKTPPRFAISKRNRWMIEHSDYVVTYVRRSFGGAAQSKALAEKKGKKVIELA